MLEARAMASAAQADLVDRLGRDRVLLGENARRAAGFDPAGREGPIAVVRPTQAEHVEHIVRIGRMRHAPVEVRGRLPALQPDDLRDAIVLDTTGLLRPPAIDTGRRVVTVGAGVEIGAIDRAARQARLCLRGTPGTLAGDTVGSLLAAGDPGELGLGDGSLVADLVSALVVTGGGRVLRVGTADLLGQPPWLGEGLPDPLPLLLASEGRMAVLCEVTLRLHRAPHVAWSSTVLPDDRKSLLCLLTAAREALSRRVADSVLATEHDGQLHLHVRAATWRGEDDVAAVARATAEGFERQGLRLADFVIEDKRVRLGQQAGPWPLGAERMGGERTGGMLDLRVAWPDVPGLLDVADALQAETGEPPRRDWAFGCEFVRLRCHLGPTRPDQHPLVQRFHVLLDSGAIPIGPGGKLRTPVRERMSPAAKVLLTALARAWDPEGVLSPKGGLL